MTFKYESEHEIKWRAVNSFLSDVGFWVKWQRNFYTDQYQYALGKRGEHMPMGVQRGGNKRNGEAAIE